MVPAEDDGSFGEGSDIPTSKFLPPTVGIDRPSNISIADALQDVAGLAHPAENSGGRFAGVSAIGSAVSASDAVEEQQRTAEPVDLANCFLNDLAKVAVVLGNKDVVNGPPGKAAALNQRETETTIGCSLSFGPQDDIEDGIVQFRAWNLSGQDVNVGALYLVVHEKPPLDPEVRIKTFIPVPINPTEYWYAAYSRTSPNYVPQE
jgi:hypothetical protein